MGVERVSYSGVVRAKVARRLGAGVSAACAAVALACAPPPAGALPSLSHHGRWLTDPRGRVVILHGVQEWAPTGPLPGPLPYGHKVPATIGYGPDAARFLSRNGFNLMRLSLSYWEYAPGRFDNGYLDGFRRFVDQLDSTGVYSLLDLQQAIYGPYFYEGEGFPSWMVDTNGIASNNAGYPTAYYSDPAENRAWDNFWANQPASDGVGLEDHLARGWQHLARRFAGTRGLLGYDLLNEPWPSCFNPAGCPGGGFDATELSALYRRIVPAIRRVDPNQLLIYEPNLLFDFGRQTGVIAPHDAHLVFGFHDYCLSGGSPGGSESSACAAEDPEPIRNAISYDQHAGDGLLLGEWGGTSGPQDIARMVTLADEYMLPWSYWYYGSLVPNPLLPPRGANLNMANLELLVRPYPQLLSGTPTSWSFEPRSKTFTLTYTTRRVAGGRFPAGAESDIFIPELQYPHGYHIAVAGAGVLRSGDHQHLRLATCRGARTVIVRVVPGMGRTTSCRV
jgi:endoglycosylceramidase